MYVVSLVLCSSITEVTRLASNDKTAFVNHLFWCVVDYIGYDDLWKQRIIEERGPHYFAKKSEPAHAKGDESFIKEKVKPTRNFFSLIAHLLLAAAAAPFIFVSLQCIRRRLSVSIDDKLPSEEDRLTMDNSITTSYGATNQFQMKNGTNGRNVN